MTAYDCLSRLREADPARHVAVDDDLLDIRLQPEDDWRQFCDETPMTPAQERAFWIKTACALAAKREQLP